MNKIPLLVTGLVLLSIIHTAIAQDDDWRDELICTDGEKKACGSSIGECEPGERLCVAGIWGECFGEKGPEEEVCNTALDDDCNGVVDDCYFEFPIPGWVLIMIGALMFIGAWVYEKMVVVKKEQMNQEESEA